MNFEIAEVKIHPAGAAKKRDPITRAKLIATGAGDVIC
jgi:hypothetical protein